MKRFQVVFPLALVVLTLSSQVALSSTKLRAILTHADEGPIVPVSSNGGPRPTSHGIAIFELNDAQTSMTMFARIYNLDFGGQSPAELNDNVTVAHIHGNDANTLPPTTRPVVWGFLGTPDNDVAPNDLVILPFGNAPGAFVLSKWDQLEGNGTNTLTNNISRILNEKTYLNFHTSQFAGGEIRGTLTIIPEPATLVLLGCGVAAVALRRRRGR